MLEFHVMMGKRRIVESTLIGRERCDMAGGVCEREGKLEGVGGYCSVTVLSYCSRSCLS